MPRLWRHSSARYACDASPSLTTRAALHLPVCWSSLLLLRPLPVSAEPSAVAQQARQPLPPALLLSLQTQLRLICDCEWVPDAAVLLPRLAPACGDCRRRVGWEGRPRRQLWVAVPPAMPPRTVAASLQQLLQLLQLQRLQLG